MTDDGGLEGGIPRTMYVVGEGTYNWFHAEEAYYSRETAETRAAEEGWVIEEVEVKGRDE